MKIDKDLQEKLQELNLAEQQLQNFSLQKQAFQIELNETESALEETEKSKGDIYKITGQIMIKANKEDLIKELHEKKEILSLRVKSIENQEKIIIEKMEKSKKILEERFSDKKNNSAK
jgi:prefoldin beta subunit